MAKKAQSIDPATILTFPFQDGAWFKKLLIASLLVFFSFIPVIPLVILLGYAAMIIRSIVVEKQTPTLPEWSDLSELFNEGLRLFGVGVVYMLPATFLIGIGYLGVFIPVLIMESGLLSETEAVIFLIAGYLAGFGLMGIGTLITMITGIILSIAGTHLVAKDDFSAAFRFRELWLIFKANWGGFLIAFLIIFGAGMLSYYATYFLVATIILCCLYPFALCFITSYLMIISAGLFGNAYSVAIEKMGK